MSRQSEGAAGASAHITAVAEATINAFAGASAAKAAR